MAQEPVGFLAAQPGLLQDRRTGGPHRRNALAAAPGIKRPHQGRGRFRAGQQAQGLGHLGAQAGQGGLGAGDQGLLFGAALLPAGRHRLPLGPLALLLGGGEGQAFLLLGLAQLQQGALGVAFAGQRFGFAAPGPGFRLQSPPRRPRRPIFLHQGPALR